MADVQPKNTTSAARGRQGDSCVMVIFGATGDLAKRKLFPALYNLAAAKLLAEKFAVIGVSNVELSSEAFREQIGKELGEFAAEKIEPQIWQRIADRLSYIKGDFREPASYKRLKEQLEAAGKGAGGVGNYLFYLATAPAFFAEITKQLGAAGLVEERDGQWRRVIVEKPFGRDLDSARELNRKLRKILDEPQIYRIDHYMGKETVQNLMAFRFGNGIFEPVWNRRYIDHIQITVAETVGVEERAGYYESSGALRDMVPNHIFQLISLTAMEPPNSFDADAVRDEKYKILHALEPPAPERVLNCAVRGQYDAGEIAGQTVRAYRSEEGVKPDSGTETFVALKLSIDNWRWAGVPFYIRTGKRMHTRTTEIAVQFQRPPALLFRETGTGALAPNVLVMHIQPDEGISLSFGAKIPGPVVRIGSVEMKFNYSEYFGSTPITGYETLIHDCMIGDATLFQRDDMTEAGWRVVQPILDVWTALPTRDFPNYASGGWGPTEADDLLKRDNREWRNVS